MALFAMAYHTATSMDIRHLTAWLDQTQMFRHKAKALKPHTPGPIDSLVCFLGSRCGCYP